MINSGDVYPLNKPMGCFSTKRSSHGWKAHCLGGGGGGGLDCSGDGIVVTVHIPPGGGGAQASLGLLAVSWVQGTGVLVCFSPRGCIHCVVCTQM